MPDAIRALTSKKAKLVALKQQVKADADRQIADIDRQIGDVDRAIGIVNEAIKDIICPMCGGSPVDVTIRAGGYATIDTGVHVEIPDGYVGLLTSKSGLMRDKGMADTTGP